MNEEGNKKMDDGLSRRGFMGAVAGAVAAAPLAGAWLPAGTAQAAEAGKAPAILKRGRNARPNILLVFTDQERYITRWPKGYRLPGHERMQQRGVTFRKHYAPAVMCTSSRSVLLTGLQTRDTKMFENTDLPWIGSLSTGIPTLGHMLRKAGYYSAYKGKWHLNKEFDTDRPTRLFETEMDAYGFSDFVWPGDVLAHTLGGYKHDHMIGGSAISWLREKGRPLSDEGKPWSLVVSLVNPHDIMYFNSDAPGERVQDTGKLLMHAAPAPGHPAYRKRWEHPLPANLRQPFDAPGRPGAHAEFNRAWGYTLGNIPLEDARWRRFSDFYFNSLAAVDAQLLRILDELEALGLKDDTAVVFTSDHGEMGGAHGLRGKGPFAYEQTTHLPMYVSHPDVKGGQDCGALTGHIDVVPTLLSLAGVDAAKMGEFAGRDLPGRNFAGVLSNPRAAGLNSVRESVLFTFSGISANDSEVIRFVSEARAAGRDPKSVLKEAGYRPNMKKRGSLRMAFDGRYKLTRYFSPVERNQPRDLDELFRWNDVELFDLANDPNEMTNLALDRERHAEVLLSMTRKLDTVMRAEFGPDDGAEMPPFEGIDWSIDRLDL